jgi:hypothetical protein
LRCHFCSTSIIQFHSPILCMCITSTPPCHLFHLFPSQAVFLSILMFRCHLMFHLLLFADPLQWSLSFRPMYDPFHSVLIPIFRDPPLQGFGISTKKEGAFFFR